MDPIDALCRILKQGREREAERLIELSNADLVDLAWKIHTGEYYSEHRGEILQMLSREQLKEFSETT